MRLKELQSKYSFLRDDVELAMELEDDMIVSDCIEDFRQLALTQSS